MRKCIEQLPVDLRTGATAFTLKERRCDGHNEKTLSVWSLDLELKSVNFFNTYKLDTAALNV